MKIKKQLLIFAALMILLLGAVSATDISDDTTDTNGMAEETVQQTQTATDINTIIQDNEEKDIERKSNPENSASTTKTIQKNTNKDNTKEATTVSNWNDLMRNINDATEDTTITLQDNITNDITIFLNKPGITITIDGNGKTINGAQNQVFFINSGSTLFLKNITITNAKSSFGGAIENRGTLNITHTTLANNTATENGGAIDNYGGTLTITDSTLNNNTATENGGAISNDFGTLNITHTTLNNNTANQRGGAIYKVNQGKVSISYSTLKGNHGSWYGGVIFDWTTNEEDKCIVLSCSNFTENYAGNGAVIYNYQNHGTYDITYNQFQNNTAGNTETLSLGANKERTVKENTYDNTDIKLKTINLTVMDEQQQYTTEDEIKLNFTLELENPDNYDEDILEKLNKTLYINDKENVTTTSNSYTLSNLKPGKYSINYTSCNQQSNTITIKILGPAKKDVYNYTQLIDAINEAKNEEYILYTINLHPGDYNATNTTEWGDSATRNIIINGNGITLNGNNTHQFIKIINENNNLTLNNVTITNYTAYYGGAISNYGTLTITDSTLQNNTATSMGGAINNQGTLNITHTTLQNNTAQYGGAINNQGTLNITDSTIANNTATQNGGAIHNHGTLNITDSTIANNTATQNGGAINNNRGTLNITQTTLNNNNATQNGGAIRNNGGTLNITDSTIANNTATQNGGAIFNYGTISITDSTIANNTAQTNSGGAIYNNYGTLNINDSFIENNTSPVHGGAIYNVHETNIFNSTLKHNKAGWYGGAIFNYESGWDVKFNVTETIFIQNHAGSAGAICSDNDGITNIIIKNTFTGNTAEDNETLVINGEKTIEKNIYDSTDISFKTMNLTVKDNQETFETGEDVELNSTIELEHPDYYDNNILEKLNKTLYINNKENITTTSDSHTLSNLKPGKYSIYYTSCNQQSNTVTFKVMGNSEITTPDDSYDYYDGVQNTITLNINDPSEEKGTADIRVKDGDIYQELVSCQNVNDGYALSTETLKEALENLYDELGDSYTINVTYSSEYALPSSTEFTLNIIKQRNTTINYNIINNTEGNVQINITVLDDIYKTPVSDATIKITGDIQQETTSGVITDTTLTPGDYTITVQYEENTDYKSSTATIDFTVEIDKDKKISELENNITNLTNQLEEKQKELEEANKLINTLHETNKNLTQKLEEAKEQITTLTNTITNLNKEIKTLNDTVNSLTEELKDANNEINSLNNDNDELTKELETANKEIETLINKIDNLTEQLTAANNEINSLNNVNDELTKQLEDANKEIETLNNKINNLTKQLTEANNKINTLNDINGELTKDLEDADKEIETLNNKINNLTEQLTEAINQMNSLTNKVNNLTNQLTEADKQINDKNKEIETLSDTINSLTEQLNDAKEKIENLNKIIDELLNKKPLNTTITINPIKSGIGEIATLTANIIAQNGDRVTGGKAVFKVNGITLKDENNNVIYATVTDGTASISYKVQDVWMKSTSTVQAVYGGTEKYAEARTNASDVLDISKGKATITLEKETMTVKAGQTLTLKATVLDANSDRINTGKVVFKLNGKTLKDDNGEVLYAYVKDGQASIDYTIPSIYSAKAYTLTAVFGGGNYERAETSGTLMLERKAVSINTDKITTKNNKTTIKATITDETDNLLVTSTKLAIKINGKTVLNNVTSTNGKIDVSFTLPLRPGMYELTIISGENGLYNKGTLTTVLKV